METELIVVTLVSLGLAMAMSVVAWRLLRDDRHRSHARSDALREMADAVEPEPSFEEMRFRSLEAEPDLELKWDAPLRARPAPAKPSAAPQRKAIVDVPEPTFSFNEDGRVPSRRSAVVAAMVVVIAGAAGSVYMLYRPQVTDAIPSARELTSAAAQPGAQPIELLSLRHVVAVVYLFDRDGNYFASGKAALDFTALEPGEESPFVVHVPSVGRVSRYRVGFRSEEGGVVAHVDRRGQLPGGTTGDAIEARPSVSPVTSARRSEG